MTQELKVGDRVRQIRDDYWRGMTGVYDGRRKDQYGYHEIWDYFIPDADAKYSDGTPYNADRVPCGMHVGSFELIEEPTPIPADIAERAMALVEKIAASQLSGTLHEAQSILDALKPVDPDDEEANAVVERYELATNVKMSGALNNTVLSVALAAIKRGRELERGGE